MIENLFNASICDAVVKGTCVALQETDVGQLIVYAGPLTRCPEVAGLLILLNAEDFDVLNSFVNKRKH